MYAEPLQIAASETVILKPDRRPFRLWPVQEKRRIVEETYQPGASVSVVARRNDVNSNQVFRWRREYQRGDYGPSAPVRKGPDFLPVGVIGEDGRLVPDGVGIEQDYKPLPGEQPALEGARPQSPSPATRMAGRVEIELPGLARLIFDATLDDAALRRLIRVIKELA